MIKKVNLLTILLSGLRHRWLVYFRPRYTIHSLLNRKGECLTCGRCCLLNKPWCRYFEKQKTAESEARRCFEKQKTAESEARRCFINGKCQIPDRQPFFCKIFPIDEKDKEMSGVSEECGYRWNSENPQIGKNLLKSKSGAVQKDR